MQSSLPCHGSASKEQHCKMVLDMWNKSPWNDSYLASLVDLVWCCANWQIGKHERSVSMLAHSCSTRAEVKGKCTKTTWWRIRLCKGVRCAEFNQHQTEEANVSSEAKTPCLLLCNSDSSELVCAFWFPCRGYRMPMPRLRFMISLI